MKKKIEGKINLHLFTSDLKWKDSFSLKSASLLQMFSWQSSHWEFLPQVTLRLRLHLLSTRMEYVHFVAVHHSWTFQEI